MCLDVFGKRLKSWKNKNLNGNNIHKNYVQKGPNTKIRLFSRKAAIQRFTKVKDSKNVKM
jgi:hypothetical protein